MCSLMLFIIFYGTIYNSFAFEQRCSNATVSRMKRSLKLPDGSSFVSTLQLLKAIQINEPSPINLLLEFDVQWKIPNPSRSSVKNPTRLSRYHRRELYANFELALNRQKLPGKLCILRSICEAKLFLSPEGVSFVDDMLRVILSSPQDSESKIDEYDVAFLSNEICDIAYPCSFSLLGLMLR